MAAYDYRCRNCGNVFTVRAVCPVCHVQDAKQVIGAPMLAGVGANTNNKSISLPVQSGSCCGSGGSCGCG